MFEIIKMINTILTNILKYPGEEKYCKLRLTNEKIKNNIAQVYQANFLMELIGFEKMSIFCEQSQACEPYLVLNSNVADARDLANLSSIILEIIKSSNMIPLTSKI